MTLFLCLVLPLVVFALLNALHHRAIKQDLRSVEIATAFRRRQRGRS